MKYFLFFAVIIVLFIACQSAELTSAKVYAQQNNYPAALEQLKTAETKEPANAEIFYMMGKIYAEMDSFDQMNRSFNRALELDTTLKKDIRAWRTEKRAETFNKGLKAAENKNWDKAIGYLKTSVMIDPEFFDGWANLGYCYQQKGDDENAIASYHKAYSIDPMNINIAKQVAVDFFNSEKVSEAIGVLEKIISGGKPDVEVFTLLAQMYAANNQPEKSDSMISKALALDPDNPNLNFDAGVAKFNQKKYDEAIVFFKKVLTLKPGDRDALYNLSISQFSAEKYSDAVATAEQLVKNNPQDKAGWEQYAYSLMRAGQPDKGKAALIVSESIGKMNQNKNEEIIASLEPVVKKYPDWCGPWAILKVCCEAIGDKTGGEKAQKGLDSCGK